MSKSNIKIPVNGPRLFVALIEPDIPQNTGNIARLCAATNTKLVLVRPFGFRLTDKALSRAGMDYWKQLDPIIFDDSDEFADWCEDKRMLCLSAHANINYAAFKYQPDDVLVFGSESSGLPESILSTAKQKNRLITLPMLEQARCINVSSSVAAVTYEALRQIYQWSEV